MIASLNHSCKMISIMKFLRTSSMQISSLPPFYFFTFIHSFANNRHCMHIITIPCCLHIVLGGVTHSRCITQLARCCMSSKLFSTLEKMMHTNYVVPWHNLTKISTFLGWLLLCSTSSMINIYLYSCHMFYLLSLRKYHPTKNKIDAL